MERTRTVVVVLPAYNEGRMVRDVIAHLPDSIDGIPLIPIVVDDGSSDQTSRGARDAGALVVRHRTNLGVGVATRTGFRAACELDADVIVTMDADGQHDPNDLPTLVRAITNGDCDVALGTRPISFRTMPWSRYIANTLSYAVVAMLYGRRVDDSQSGFKAFTRHAVETMELSANGYEICSEMVGEMFSKKLRYRSVPIRAIYTEYSQRKAQPFLNGVNIILRLLAGRLIHVR